MGSDDLAKGKLFDQADVQRCLHGGGYRIERRNTDTEIDFTARSRSGAVTVDFGVESGPDQAEAREAAWTKLAEQAEVENAGDYYFRYGNVVAAYERVPSASAAPASSAAFHEPLGAGASDPVGSRRVNHSDSNAASATAPSASRRASSCASP